MTRKWRFSLIILGLATIALLLTDTKLLIDQRQINHSALLPTLSATLPSAQNAADGGNLAPQASMSAPLNAVLPLPENAALHTVQNGETLYRIAQTYGITTEALAAANQLADPSLVYVGQTLHIPQSESQSIAIVVPTTEAPPPTEPAPLPTETLNLPAPTLLPPTTIPATVTYPPLPGVLNGVPVEAFVILPDAVRENIREIYARGQALGQNPHAFTKVGDSIIEHPYFLGRFDGQEYNLGEFGDLQQVITYFNGSFGRPSVAVRRGLHSWSVLDPMWADKSLCQPGESVMACELRLSRASIVFIRLGTNDVGIPNEFDKNMREIVEFAITSGVIPVLGTKADRYEGSDINNTILRQITADYQVPLWDFDLIAQTIPGKGLEVDGIHLTTYYAHDYTSPEAYRRGHGVHNLSALLMLDRIWREVTS